MEDQAPYQAAAPQHPRNLAAPIAAWLRTQGFTATEQPYATLATVAAHWQSPRGERFQFDYSWSAGASADATCRLEVGHPGCMLPETLFTAQQVRRLKDVRQLVSNCVRLANARLLARLPHPTL